MQGPTGRAAGASRPEERTRPRNTGWRPVPRLARSKRAAEVDDVAVLDDVLLAFEPLEVLGLGILERAGCAKVVEGGHLGADESLGQVGVDLGGGLDRAGPAFEVPAPDLGLTRREERDDADGIIGPADDPLAAQLADLQVGQERG